VLLEESTDHRLNFLFFLVKLIFMMCWEVSRVCSSWCRTRHGR